MCPKAHANYWMYMKIQVNVEPTGAGKVYASTDQSVANNGNNCGDAPFTDDASTHESYINNGSTLWYLNTVNNDPTRYAFVGWRDDTGTNGAAGSIVSEEQNPSTGFKDVGQYAAKNKDGSGGKTTDKPYYPPNPFNPTLYMTAVYHEIARAVIAVPQDISVGGAEVTKITSATQGTHPLDNEVGDEVEIKAWALGYQSKFIGWYKDGEFVTKTNPYRFTVTEENKGTYVARYSTGHQFLRIKSKEKQRFIHAVSDQGSQTDFSALQLIGSGELYLPGTIFHIRDWKVTGGRPYSYEVQGFNSESMYNTSSGVYVTMLQNTDDDTWLIFAKGTSLYMQDNGTTNHVTPHEDHNEEYNKWRFEVIDKDLSTHDKYFSVDPDELLRDERTGLYCTTLRTSWKCRFADATHKDITAYIVTGIDENGEAVLEEVTGDIIPAGVPVVLMCKTNDPEKNVMIPTTEAATFDAAANILASSVKYFDNQPLPDSGSTYRKLTRRSDGSVGFIDVVADNTMNGNRAYLVADEDVMLPEMEQEVTLAGLVSEGEVGKKYAVTDLTCVAVREIDNEHTALYCKDDNAVAADARQVMADGQTDYMAANGFGAAADYDQSHWLELTIPGKVGSSYNPIGRRLTDVSGTLTDLENPALTARALPTIGDENAYTLNNYIVPSLQGTQAGNNGRTYFFVTPQVMEVATINWAQWDAKAQKFITPPSTTPGVNTAGLQGEFFANFSYAEGSELIENYPYSFKAVLRSEPGTESSVVKAPRRAGGTKSLVAYPLEPLTVERQDGQVVTTVDRVTAGRQVLRVDYCNLQGQVSHTPWPGLNIEVTRFDDGTVTTRKVLK